MKVYSRIKSLREDKDLTQAQIARHLNIAQRTYSRYETGASNIPIDILVKLARYHHTSTDYLLELTNTKEITYKD